MHTRPVSNDVFRDRYLYLAKRDLLTITELSALMEIPRKTTELKRELGLERNEGGSYQTHITKRTALRLAEALHLDPVDFGL